MLMTFLNEAFPFSLLSLFSVEVNPPIIFSKGSCHLGLCVIFHCHDAAHVIRYDIRSAIRWFDSLSESTANVTVTFSAHVRNVTDFETVNSMGLLPH